MFALISGGLGERQSDAAAAASCEEEASARPDSPFLSQNPPQRLEAEWGAGGSSEPGRAGGAGLSEGERRRARPGVGPA